MKEETQFTLGRLSGRLWHQNPSSDLLDDLENHIKSEEDIDSVIDWLKDGDSSNHTEGQQDAICNWIVAVHSGNADDIENTRNVLNKAEENCEKNGEYSY